MSGERDGAPAQPPTSGSHTVAGARRVRSTLWFVPKPVVSQLRLHELLEVVDMRDDPLRGMVRAGRPSTPSDRAVFTVDADVGALLSRGAAAAGVARAVGVTLLGGSGSHAPPSPLSSSSANTSPRGPLPQT